MPDKACYYHQDKTLGDILIPGCMGAAIGGIDNCTCRSYKEVKMTDAEIIFELNKKNKELENEIINLKKLVQNIN